MSDWYEKVNKDTEGIVRKIKAHPFIIALMDGTLPGEIFDHYINQDALYLAEYRKVLASVGVRCARQEDTQFFLAAATGIIQVENILHQKFLQGHSFAPLPSPTCELYISYLSRIVHTRSVEEGLAAVLPCFTIYKQVGDHILKNQTNRSDNPYQDWIDTYGGEEFGKSVEQAINITNSHAEKASRETLDAMNLAFGKSSRLEWMFWDSAYHKEVWKV